MVSLLPHTYCQTWILVLYFYSHALFLVTSLPPVLNSSPRLSSYQPGLLKLLCINSSGIPVMWGWRESPFAWYAKPSLRGLLLFHSTSLLQLHPWNLMLPPNKMICSLELCTFTSLRTFPLGLGFHIHSRSKSRITSSYKACQTE